MSRNVKRKAKESVEVDIMKPIKTEQFDDMVQEGDCFGSMWSAAATECKVCGIEAVCSTMCRVARKKKEKEKEKEEGPYLDQVREMTKKELEKIKEYIIEAHKDGEPVTTEEMFQTFKVRMRTKDDVAVIQRIKMFVKAEKNIYTKGGKFYSKTNE